MTPVPDAVEGTPDARYNRAHIASRNCVERCNGVLKGKFRCLNNERGLRYSPDMVGKIITACAVLHNMSVQYRIDGDLDIVEELEQVNLVVQPLPEDMLNEGRRIRTNIINRYFHH